MDKKKIIKLLLVFFIILFVVSIGYFIYRENNDVFSILAAQSKNAVYSNLPTGFYDNDIKVKLKKDSLLPFEAKIFYTTNGEDPDKYSNEYKSEINIKCEKEEQVIPLKVVAYYKGKYSKVQNFTYIVCDGIKERYNMPIISITTNRDNLYDFDRGLFVPGTTYENSLREYDGDDYFDQTIMSGNYRERTDDTWIRNAEVIMFDNAGQILNEDNIGFAISGGTSSAQYPKSLKLISNYQNPTSQFEIRFLDTIEQANFSIVDYYNTIRIRSGTQSGVGGNIRSTLVSELANEAQFDGCFMSKIVLVYLNGRFYGIMDMEQNYSDSFIKNKYNLEDVNKVFKVKGNEKECFKGAGLDKLFELDLTKTENQNKLEEKVDIENYLEYYAVNICINNTDWPQNNYEIWYYTGDKDVNNPYTDGRARFLMYDMDMTFKTEKDGEWAEDVFQRIVKESERSGTTGFSKLMKIKKYRDLFVTILLNYKKVSFYEDNIVRKIDAIKAYIEKESDVQFQNTGWIEDLGRETSLIKTASKTILSRIDNDLKELFDLEKTYEFSCSNPKGGTARITNKTIYEDENYKNEYYKGVDFEIEIIPNPGYNIDSILINGKEISKSQYEDKTEILGKIYVLKINDSLIKDNKIAISFVTSRNDSKNLIISEISAKDYNDWIKISNYGENEISLSEYYLSNKEKNLLLYNLPNIKLKVGESIVIDGKKNHYLIGDYICNFSISKYQTIYLTKCKEKNSSKEVVDKIYVPKMQLNESYGRVKNSNIWNFYENNNSKRRK